MSWVVSRSSRPVVFCKRDTLENFAEFTENPLSLDSLFNRVTKNPRATADNILVAGEKFVEQRHLSNFQKQPHQKWSVKKSFLENFTKFTGKHVFCNFIKRLYHRCFLVKFAKFLRMPILKNICERLLLNFKGKF